jgi:hypothetical protein
MAIFSPVIKCKGLFTVSAQPVCELMTEKSDRNRMAGFRPAGQIGASERSFNRLSSRYTEAAHDRFCSCQSANGYVPYTAEASSSDETKNQFTSG